MKKHFGNWVEKHQYSTLSIILVGFSAIALGNITRWSRWFDEAFGAYMIRFNYAEITQYTAADVHPPLYYYALKTWSLFFGTSDVALRSLSVVFAVVALVGVFKLIKYLFDSPRVALAATFFAALSPMLVRFADEARMYTMVAAIIVWATYVLVRLSKKSSALGWVGYGLLITAGVYTHYFTVLVWLGHWVWRFWLHRRGEIKRFFSKEWVLVHAGAIAVFAPWLPTMVQQTVHVQGGFWVPRITIETPADYLSNTLLYQEYGRAVDYWAFVFWLGVVAAGFLAYWSRRWFEVRHRSGLALLVIMSVVPPLLLLALSLPPLRSTFIDRYMLGPIVLLTALLGVTAFAALQNGQRAKVAVGTLVILLSVGIGNVYYLGNYNKNSNTSIRTRDVIEGIHQKDPNATPIIAGSPWVYYEAFGYSTPRHEVYYLADSLNRNWGSLRMLKDNSINKITNLNRFAEQHRYVWYVSSRRNELIEPPVPTWQARDHIAVYDYITKDTRYQATLYDTYPVQSGQP